MAGVKAVQDGREDAESADGLHSSIQIPNTATPDMPQQPGTGGQAPPELSMAQEQMLQDFEESFRLSASSSFIFAMRAALETLNRQNAVEYSDDDGDGSDNSPETESPPPPYEPPNIRVYPPPAPRTADVESRSARTTLSGAIPLQTLRPVHTPLSMRETPLGHHRRSAYSSSSVSFNPIVGMPNDKLNAALRAVEDAEIARDVRRREKRLRQRMCKRTSCWVLAFLSIGMVALSCGLWYGLPDDGLHDNTGLLDSPGWHGNQGLPES